jgi:hypothetical protein
LKSIGKGGGGEREITDSKEEMHHRIDVNI